MAERSSAWWYVPLGALATVVLFPVYMTVVRALSDTGAYVRAGQPPWPVEPEWDVFGRALEGDLGRQLVVSAAVTGAIVAAQLTTSVLAAYAFAFLDFPAKRVLFALFLATMMLPIEVTLIPNVATIRELGWMNTYQGLAVPFLASAVGTFLLRQAFLGIPRDLRDAAELDGLGHLRFLVTVVVPLARPAIASLALLAFLGAWNQYTWPAAVTTAPEWNTAQVGLRAVAAENPAEQNLAVAAALVVAVPIVVLLVAFQRQLVRGLTTGAVR